MTWLTRGRESLAVMTGVSRLPAGLASGGAFNHGLGRTRGIGGGRGRGVGGVAGQLSAEVVDFGFQFGNPMQAASKRVRKWTHSVHDATGGEATSLMGYEDKSCSTKCKRAERLRPLLGRKVGRAAAAKGSVKDEGSRFSWNVTTDRAVGGVIDGSGPLGRRTLIRDPVGRCRPPGTPVF